MTDLAHIDAAAAGGRAPRALQAAGAAGLAARRSARSAAGAATQPPARQRRGRGADHDRVGEQGTAVPGRVPAVRVQQQRAGTPSCALPRAATPCLRRRRHDSPDFDAVAKRAAHEDAGDDSRLTLRRADPGAVAGGGLVGAVADEPNGGLSPAAARPAARRVAVPDRVRAAKITDDDAMARLQAVGGGRAGRSIERVGRRAPCPSRPHGRRRRVRRPALPPRDRHRLAPHVVLRR